MAHTFDGFDRRTLRFLAGIRRENTRDRLVKRRADYLEYYVDPGIAFIDAVGPRLRRLVPGIRAEARVGGSLFSLIKDARFAPRERPLREHMELWFWEGERRAAASAFVLRIEPGAVRIGAGHRRLEGERLEAYRRAVTDRVAGAALARIVGRLERMGHDLEAPDLARWPRGYEDVASGPAAGFLLQRSLYAEVERGAAVATSPELVEQCLEVWRQLRPLHRWLVEHVQGGTDGAAALCSSA